MKIIPLILLLALAACSKSPPTAQRQLLSSDIPSPCYPDPCEGTNLPDFTPNYPIDLFVLGYQGTNVTLFKTNTLPSHSYDLQGSVNLASWLSIGGFVAESNSVTLVIPVGPSFPIFYFRTRGIN